MKTLEIMTDVKLITMECGKCGTIFAMSEAKYRRCNEKGEDWHCPNGHCREFTTSELDRLRHKIDQTEAELETARCQRDGALRQVSAHKGVVTRIKNRVRNGVCTECHRHFENLERHMETKHSK